MRVIGRRAADGGPKQVAFMDDFGEEVEVRRCLDCRFWLPTLCFTPQGKKYLGVRCLACAAARARRKGGRAHLPINGRGPDGIIYVRGLPTVNRELPDGTMLRRCSVCEEWLPREENFLPFIRANGGISWDSYCRVDRAAARRATGERDRGNAEARRARARERQELVRMDPFLLERQRKLKREASRRARARNPEATREANRKYEARVRADPALYRARLARAREARRVRRLEAGEPVRESRVVAGSQGIPMLPAGPLAAAVVREVARSGADLERVCALAGVDSTNVRAWESGRRQTVQFDVADRVLTRLGLLWWEVWTDEGAAEAHRSFEGEAEAA